MWKFTIFCDVHLELCILKQIWKNVALTPFQGVNPDYYYIGGSLKSIARLHRQSDHQIYWTLWRSRQKGYHTVNLQGWTLGNIEVESTLVLTATDPPSLHYFASSNLSGGNFIFLPGIWSLSPHPVAILNFFVLLTCLSSLLTSCIDKLLDNDMLQKWFQVNLCLLQFGRYSQSRCQSTKTTTNWLRQGRAKL